MIKSEIKMFTPIKWIECRVCILHAKLQKYAEPNIRRIDTP